MTPPPWAPGALFRRAAMLVLVGVIAACGGNDPPTNLQVSSAAESADVVPLSPGDQVRVTFSREPNLNGQFTIDEAGSVVLPLLGARNLTDRPAADVKRDLTAEYEDRLRNQSVQIVYLRRVRVLGEVREPGLFMVDPTMTLSDVIAQAGGATNIGNLESISLVRDGMVIREGLDASLPLSVSLRSGDQIFVPKTGWLSRNVGVVVGGLASAIGLVIAITQ